MNTKIVKSLLISLLTLVASATVSAHEHAFFDTSRPQKVLTFGLRAGMNSSGMQTNYLKLQPELIHGNFYWRSGMQIGGVADLHIRNYFAIEVGLYWENKGYDCSMMAATAEDDYMSSMYGHMRHNDLSVPVMLSFRLNVLPQAMYHIDIGGYWTYGIGGKKNLKSYFAYGAQDGQLVFDQMETEANYYGSNPKDFLSVDRTDLGLRVGTGLTFFNRYFVGVYYQHSLKNIAQNFDGGPNYRFQNNSWSVNIGYNF